MSGRPKGLPKTGGRKKGTPNKVTADVMALARDYTTTALKTLHEVMVDQDAPAAARVSAANAILDRAHGKPSQPLEHSGTLTVEELSEQDREILAECEARLERKIRQEIAGGSSQGLN